LRQITAIVIHCAYTPASMDIGIDEIRRWHVDGNGWRDVGYHWAIKRDGTIERGRSEAVAGAHVAGHNAESIGVCLIGGKAGSKTDCNFTRHQWKALESLVTALKTRYPTAVVKGHRDYTTAKDCPGFDVAAWWG
jgi:N-acetylmuramoyl-L-alanine amidase